MVASATALLAMTVLVIPIDIISSSLSDSIITMPLSRSLERNEQGRECSDGIGIAEHGLLVDAGTGLEGDGSVFHERQQAVVMPAVGAVVAA